jgi:TonB family protein
MKKYLTTLLILASCGFAPVFGQTTTKKAPVARQAHTKKKAATKKVSKPQHSLSSAATGEFIDHYSRDFSELPYQYKEMAYTALSNTALVRPEANLTGELAKSATLCERVYETIYDYCYAIKYGLGTLESVDALMYLLARNQLHMSAAGATELALHIKRRYDRPAPATTQNPGARPPNVEPPSQPLIEDESQEAKNVIQGKKVYTMVEQMPQLPGGGGISAIQAAIQKATNYPQRALRDKVEGRVFVAFVVDEQGNVGDVQVNRSAGTDLDEETIRAVKTLPQFTPGRQNGKPVSVSFTMPITYKLPSNAATTP